MFESVFSSIQGVGADWQIVIDKENNKDLVELHIEDQNGGKKPENFKQEIFAKVKNEISDGWKNYELGLFRLDLKVHPKGTLRTARKLTRLIDRRKF